MSTLAFFPWLRVPGPVQCEDFELVPYERGIAPGGPGTDLQRTLDAVLEVYIARGGAPVEEATLLAVGGKALGDDLTQEESDSIFPFTELLATAGLAGREFFLALGSYCSRDLFRVVVQRFDDPEHGATRVSRRRDGTNQTYTTRDALRVYRPEHASSPIVLRIDEPLLASLQRAQSEMAGGAWQAVFDAVMSFNAANTDDPNTSLQAELVSLSGALERLFDLRRGNEAELARSFAGALQPNADLAPASCERLASDTRSATVREMWVRDMFRLRGSLAHGQLTPRYQSVWNLRDHLLLASFVFPLVLKRKLESVELYEMGWRDLGHIDAFERLACAEHCVDHGEAETYPWSRIVSDVMIRYAFGGRRPLGTEQPDR